MDGGAWRATVHRITNSQTLLSNFTSLLRDHNMQACPVTLQRQRVYRNSLTCLNYLTLESPSLTFLGARGEAGSWGCHIFLP